MKVKSQHFKKNRLAVVMSIAITMTSAADATVQEGRLLLNVQMQEAGKSMLDLAAQANIHIILSEGVGKGVMLPELKGEYTLTDALDEILKGSGLSYEFISTDSIVVKKEKVGDENKKSNDTNEYMDEIVVTGSRLITNPGQMTRQMTIFDRQEIERSGATRLDEFLRRLPQNINAPSNLGSGILISNFGLGENVFAGSSVNLRGLGSQYTLILIDGRRPPRGGQFGGITDISNIPIDQVERIEVLYDGAAAIYGADAVGGVVNIITSRQYGGTTVTLTHEDTQQGGGKRTNFSVGRTFPWSDGQLTARVGYQREQEIDGSQRRTSEIVSPEIFHITPSTPGNIGSEATGFGRRVPVMWVRNLNGPDEQRVSGGVMVTETDIDPVTSEEIVRNVLRPRDAEQMRGAGYRPVYGVQLPTYNGQALTLQDVDLTNLDANGRAWGANAHVPFLGRSLTPKSTTYDVGLDLSQELIDQLDLMLSLRYSKTDKSSDTQNPASLFNVRSDAISNPFGISIDYGVVSLFPQRKQIVDQQSFSLSGDLQWQFIDDWRVILRFGLSKNKNESMGFNRPRTGTERESNAGKYVPTFFERLNGYYERDLGIDVERVQLGTHFHDPLVGLGSREELVANVIVPTETTINDATSRDLELNLQGSLMTLPAGDVRANVMLSHINQKNKVVNTNDGFSTEIFEGSSSGAVVTDFQYSEAYGVTTNGIGGELAVPLVGGNSAIRFVDDLLFNISARYEDYSNAPDQGLNWATGFKWGVNDWMTVRLNRTFSQRVAESVRSARGASGFRDQEIELWAEGRGRQFYQGNTPHIYIQGGSTDLKPERNYGTSLAFIFEPTFLEGMELQVNLYESVTVDRIGNSGIRLTRKAIRPENVALNPALSFVTADNLDYYRSLDDVYGGGKINAQVDDLVIDQREKNVGQVFSRGADLNMHYNYDTEYGTWHFVWRHQYLNKHQVVRSTVCVDSACLGEAEFQHQPVDLVGRIDEAKILGRPLPRHGDSMDLNWEYRGLGINLSTQYQQKTSILMYQNEVVLDADGNSETRRTNVYQETTTPARFLNMSLSYDFSKGDWFKVPEWLDTTRISLTINDLWRRDRKVETEIIERGWEEGVDALLNGGQLLNEYTLSPRGRSFSLRIASTF